MQAALRNPAVLEINRIKPQNVLSAGQPFMSDAKSVCEIRQAKPDFIP
jgi:hypothetical protein